MIYYNWKNADGSVENWSGWNSQRRVYNAFKAGCAVAIDLRRCAFQLAWFKSGEIQTIQFETIPDEDLRLALEALTMAGGDHSCLAFEILLRSIGQDVIADDVAFGRVDDLPGEVP